MFGFSKILAFSMLALVASMSLEELNAQTLDRATAFKRQHAWVAPLAITPRLSGNFGELRAIIFTPVWTSKQKVERGWWSWRQPLERSHV